MYRYKLTQTRPRSPQARKLQELMLAYHDFRQSRPHHPLDSAITALGRWQAERLRATHWDLYRSQRYQEGLDFLLEDLYAPQAFNQRDDDFERIFPTLVRLLPNGALQTLAWLVELNLISQQMDVALTEALVRDLDIAPEAIGRLSRADYGRGYRCVGDHRKRMRQIELVGLIGRDLERYVSNRALRMALRASRRPAEMAGLGELHQFIREGCDVFQRMEGVDQLLERVVERESWILEQMLTGQPLPETLPPAMQTAPLER